MKQPRKPTQKTHAQRDEHKPEAPHEFAAMTEFDEAMRKITQVPKELVEEAERQSHTPRTPPASGK